MDDKPKINMLLEVENIFGESTRGMGTAILTFVLCFIPVFIIIRLRLYKLIPWQLLLFICILIWVEIIMVIPGHESEKKAAYKKRRDDVHQSAESLIELKTKHAQGCFEYTDSSICFLVALELGSTSDKLMTSKQIYNFLVLAVDKRPFDILSQNMTEGLSWADKYSKVKLFSDNSASQDFIEILDHNREVITKSSRMMRTVLAIHGNKSEWKEILITIQEALSSVSAQVFKTAYMVTSPEEIDSIISRDIDADISIDEWLQKRYYTGERYGSKILGFDKDDEVSEEDEEIDNISFIPKF